MAEAYGWRVGSSYKQGILVGKLGLGPRLELGGRLEFGVGLDYILVNIWFRIKFGVGFQIWI